MNIYEEIIKKYFSSWIKNDKKVIKEIFDENVVYSECYGPIYEGADTVYKWFEDWHDHGDVLVWNINRFIHEGNTVVVEWYFKCDYDEEISEFNGVSIIVFNNENKIINLKEFESKKEHYYPYGIK